MVQHPATPPKHLPQAHAADTATETFSSCVLVGTPVTCWIPIFALGVEKGRDEVESTVLTSARALRQAVGANAARALRSDCYGAYKLVEVRGRSGRTATYGTWLHFAETEHARAFVTDYPDVAKAVS